VASSCKHGNETMVSIKSGGFLDQLSDYQNLRRTLFHGVSYWKQVQHVTLTSRNERYHIRTLGITQYQSRALRIRY
jgi:hypothetical protein